MGITWEKKKKDETRQSETETQGKWTPGGVSGVVAVVPASGNIQDPSLALPHPLPHPSQRCPAGGSAAPWPRRHGRGPQPPGALCRAQIIKPSARSGDVGLSASSFAPSRSLFLMYYLEGKVE